MQYITSNLAHYMSCLSHIPSANKKTNKQWTHFCVDTLSTALPLRIQCTWTTRVNISNTFKTEIHYKYNFILDLAYILRQNRIRLLRVISRCFFVRTWRRRATNCPRWPTTYWRSIPLLIRVQGSTIPTKGPIARQYNCPIGPSLVPYIIICRFI